MLTSDAPKTLYGSDFYLWVQTTAELLKEGKFEQLDLENLIEEIETMGRNEKRELKSRLTVLIEHLLKLKYWTEEKEANARGWRSTVVEQREQLLDLLKDSPSLKIVLENIFLDCYENARKNNIRKYAISPQLFPEQVSFLLEEVLDEDFLP
ncbi:MAG: DUF29 domain-containing protein [Leptolyngbyaceae bacterium]|nr:DUF29 domain-containing protein [Leptolyngbyaceae bacterium]